MRIAALIVLLSAATVSAQTPQKWTPGRTPDGQPDIQGTWINFDDTPFEAADPNAAPPDALQQRASNINPAPEFADHNQQVSKARKAMVVDPPSGRVPVLKWAEDKRDYDLAHIPDAP